MEITAASLLKRHSKLNSRREPWDKVYEEIASFVVPSKAGFVTKPTAGEEGTDRVFDSTAPHASSLLAASIHAAMTSPSMVWFGLRFRDDGMNEEAEAKEWLEDCVERMDAEINETSFNSEVNELYSDLVDFGTAVQLVDTDKDGRVTVRSYHLSKCSIAESKDGNVDTMFREFCWTARQIAQKWPDAELDKVTKALETDPDKEFTLVHVVFPREGKDVVMDELVDAKRRPFAEYYLLKEESQILEEGGHYEFPYMVPRWAKRSGDEYGFSQTMIAMPDIKTLNRAKELELDAWEGAISPPMKALEGDVLGDVDLRPKGLTFVRDMNALQPLNDSTNWNASMLKSDELRQSIRNIYFTDQLQLPDRAGLTATEVSIRYQTMQRLLGSTFGRLINEYLDPFVKRVFNIMLREGRFKEMPESLVNGEGDTNIDIEYVSPLARSQRMDEVQAIQGWMGFVGKMAEFYPEMLDIPDVDDASRLVAERMGVPAKAISSDEAVQDTRAKRQAQQKAQMQAAMAAQGGQGGEGEAQPVASVGG